MIYCLTVIARPTAANPEHGIVGEAYVNAWIVADTEEQATERARADITGSDWKVTEVDEISVCDDETYAKGDDNRGYYEEAKNDETVYVYHTCPRYPVYFFGIQINEPNVDDGASEARVWIMNEMVSEEYDPYEADFWSGERLQQAEKIVAEMLADHGYAIVRIQEQYPVGPDEIGDDGQYYDDAEEDGMCVVIVKDIPDEALSGDELPDGE